MARNRNTRLQIDSRQFPDWEEYETEGLFTRVAAKLGFLFKKSVTIDDPITADATDIPAIDATNDRLLIQDATDSAVKLVSPDALVSLVPTVTSDVEATPNVIPIRDANGTFKVGTPTDIAHPATLYALLRGLFGASYVYYTSGTKTWTKPAGVTWAILTIVGGGGAGGRGDFGSVRDGGGGGGGSGAQAVIFFDVTNETSLTFVVGAAGADSTVYGLTINAGAGGGVSDTGGGGGAGGTVVGTLTKGVAWETASGKAGEKGTYTSGGGGVGGSGANILYGGADGHDKPVKLGILWPAFIPRAYKLLESAGGYCANQGSAGTAGVGGGGGGGGGTNGITKYAGGAGSAGFAFLIYG